MTQEIVEMKIEYRKELVLNSINFKLSEEKKECKKRGIEYNKENYKNEICKKLIFHDNNLKIAATMMMTEKEKSSVLCFRNDALLKHKETILNEVWEKAE